MDKASWIDSFVLRMIELGDKSPRLGPAGGEALASPRRHRSAKGGSGTACHRWFAARYLSPYEAWPQRVSSTPGCPGDPRWPSEDVPA